MAQGLVTSLSPQRLGFTPRSVTCGIYGRQSGTETGFSQSSSVFACQDHPTVVLHSNAGFATTRFPSRMRLAHVAGTARARYVS
jgi:hypothetical protein